MPKKPLRKRQSAEESILIIERDLKNCKDKIKQAGKRKGEERRELVNKIQKGELRNLYNLIMDFENNILAKQDENEYANYQDLNVKLDDYKQKYETLKKQLGFVRYEGKKEADIYQYREMDELKTKEQYAQKIQSAQKDSEAAVKNMLRMLHETKQIGNSVNVELERQLQALDSIHTNLHDTESTMNRALRHINYFARSVYTDKLLILLIVLVVLAVIAIIVLSAMGKIGTPTETIS